ncbi:zf-TFIIB domain-containing protein [Paraburkholderia phytofirmans]
MSTQAATRCSSSSLRTGRFAASPAHGCRGCTGIWL